MSELFPPPTPPIPGLRFVPDWITPEHHAELLAFVDAQPWRDDLKRRVQHYGWRYDYTRKSVDPDHYLGPLPPPLNGLASRLHATGWVPQRPTQAIVNEYLPGQGIAAHVPCFADGIASLSLGAPAPMVFTPLDGGERHSLDLTPRGLLVLCEDARYRWRHAIPARQSDPDTPRRRPRGRRVSVTFRALANQRPRP